MISRSVPRSSRKRRRCATGSISKRFVSGAKLAVGCTTRARASPPSRINVVYTQVLSPILSPRSNTIWLREPRIAGKIAAHQSRDGSTAAIGKLPRTAPGVLIGRKADGRQQAAHLSRKIATGVDDGIPSSPTERRLPRTRMTADRPGSR